MNKIYKIEEIIEWLLAHDKFIELMNYSDGITNHKLQKLLFYAQGLYLALNDKPLFNEDFEVWESGPVIRDIYFKYKDNNSRSIEYEEDYELENLNQEVQDFLELIYNNFAIYSTYGLSNMVNEEDIVIKAKNSESKSLDKETIKKYFKEHLGEFLDEE